MKNILMLNVGTRTKLVSYFINEANNRMKVIATDNYFLAPALYVADSYYVTKRWDEDGYWEQIYDICENNNIGLVLSLVDPELVGLSERRKCFEERGILVNISKKEIVEACFDKYQMLEYIRENQFPYIKTYLCGQKIDLDFPVFVKPRYGSGSQCVEKVMDAERLREISQKDDMIIQEFMQGQEYGIDVYVDLISGEVISIFIKKKLKMRAGETDKSVSCKNEQLFELIRDFVCKTGLRGANDIDVFEKDGKFYISEVNPRFGGGYLHAYECGQNFPKYLINNLEGKVNIPEIGNYEPEVYMMKYFDILMKKFDCGDESEA